MSLNNKVALITGGGKNLGAAIAADLAAHGAHLALHYNAASSHAEADATQKRLAADHPGLHVRLYQGDLTTAAAVDRLFAAVLTDFGRVDVVVHTVGKVLKKPMVEMTEEEYDEMFRVNTKANFLVLKAAARHVQDGGRIVSIVTSLLAAFTGHYTAYAGSKAPVEHFTRGLAKELQPRGVRVNAVAPGPMDTPFFYPQESPDAVAFHKSQALDNRLTDVRDIAPVVRFLVTDGGWITGQTIFANGGYTTR